MGSVCCFGYSSYSSASASYRPDTQIRARVFRRYGSLILIGFVLNVILWGPSRFWIWDVLEVIGTANIMAACIFLVDSSDLVLGISALLFLSSFYLILHINFPYPLGLVLNNPLKGIFPLEVFLFFTLAGVMVGKRFISHIQSGEGRKCLAFCLVLSSLAIPLGYVLHFLGVVVDRYPPSISYVVLSSGVTFWLSRLFSGGRICGGAGRGCLHQLWSTAAMLWPFTLPTI